jgi:inorganic pyrophosphatase|tara:strand:+ start:353 stop:835 length:483 start_codon:yes stop_codon:yes gene_type:complete
MSIDAYLEISKGSQIKYEYNKELKCLEVDRILHNTNSFPYNYGFIPNTLSPDGDALDIIILCDYPLLAGSMAKCKIIGGIETKDEKGIDDKIIAVLDEKLDNKSIYINDIGDINKGTLAHIIYFLNHYKDNEKDKYVEVGKIYNKSVALNKIKQYTLTDK